MIVVSYPHYRVHHCNGSPSRFFKNNLWYIWLQQSWLVIGLQYLDTIHRLCLEIISTLECLSCCLFCRRPLFQRTKRSVSMKKKRTRKSLSKTKAKPLKFLAAKKSPAKKFAAKKKRPMPGYQATAPARPRGSFRVNDQDERSNKTHQDFEKKICDGRPRAP